MDSSRKSARKETIVALIKSDAVVYPACCEAVPASGHHGHPRTEGQSLNSDLTWSTLLPAWLGAGPTGHAMIMNPR
jgi:hypothetical protein